MKRELIAVVALCALGACAAPVKDNNSRAAASEGRTKPVESDERIIVIPLETPGGHVFLKLDADGDGFLSRQEAMENDIARNFDQFDSDGDNQISAIEYHIFTTTPAGGAPPSGGSQPAAGEKWDARTY